MMDFTGVMTAIVSPFKSGVLDEESFLELIKFQYENGIRTLVVNGTTGESPTLEPDEVARMIDLIKKSPWEFNVIIGAGGNNTRRICAAAVAAEELGADAILSVVPYYNKPTQEGLYQHFKKIAEAVSIPVVLYNVPGRTVCSIEVATVKRLFEIDNIVAVKEASGDLSIIEDMAKSIPGIKILSGDDGTYVEAATKFCHGVISVISHILPKEFIDWTKRARSGDLSVVDDYKVYDPLCQMLFAEPNPVPVKNLLKHMGILASDEVRLPLVGCTDSLSESLKSEAQKRGIKCR